MEETENILLKSNSLIKSNNCLLLIREFCFWLNIMCIDTKNKFINKFSNEWLYLINYNHNPGQNYLNLHELYNEIIKFPSEKIQYYNIDAVQLFTTFSKGSVHGFSGFYYTINTYLNDYDKYKNKYILIYKESQQGILDLINYFCDKNILNRDKIVYIEKNICYKFKSITFIPNCYHVFNDDFLPLVDVFIESNLIVNPILNFEQSNHVCLIKSDNTCNVHQVGLFSHNQIIDFSNKFNIRIINTDNEIQLINDIYNCSTLILTYGSNFFKNFIYISEKCSKIIVLINGEHYINDYNTLCSRTTPYQGLILSTYKNAKIIYLNKNDLNFNPFTV